jgi:hypothetical protein
MVADPAAARASGASRVVSLRSGADCLLQPEFEMTPAFRANPVPKIPRLLRILSPRGDAIASTVTEGALSGAGIWPALSTVDVKSDCHAAAIHERAVLRSVRRV